MRVWRRIVGVAIATVGGLCVIGTSGAGASIASTLVSSSVGFAAIIQWGGSGNKLVGTYDAFGVTYDSNNTETPYSLTSDHCSIHGLVSGPTINVSLTGCSNSARDGSYVAHIQGSTFQFTFPSTDGTLENVNFKSGSIDSYNSAVSDAKFFTQQGNGLVTFETEYQPSQTYFTPTFSRPFKVGSSWFDVMTQQTNSVSYHSGAKVGAFVLKWSGAGWYRWKQLTIDTFSIPRTPFALNLGQGVTAYAVEQSWMDYSAYDVIADVGSHWQLVPFAKDTKLSKVFESSAPVTWSIKGPVFTQSIKGCTDTKHCGTAKIIYTFNAKSSDGAVFAVTGLSGPSFALAKNK